MKRGKGIKIEEKEGNKDCREGREHGSKTGKGRRFEEEQGNKD